MFKIISSVPMKDGVKVEPIEIDKTGVAIYPEGTVIVSKVVSKHKKDTTTINTGRLINMNTVIVPDTFDNNYGWNKVEREIQQHKDTVYLAKRKMYESEEGMLQEMEERYS